MLPRRLLINAVRKSLQGSRSRVIERRLPSLPFHTTASNLIKEIEIVEKEDTIEIRGVTKDSSRVPYLVEKDLSPGGREEEGEGRKECVFCKLDALGVQVKHTDVLILYQFCNKRGRPLPSRVTGLCKRQQKRLEYLVVMAEKAGLLTVFDKEGNKRELIGWEKNNKYYDESRIPDLIDSVRDRA